MELPSEARGGKLSVEESFHLKACGTHHLPGRPVAHNLGLPCLNDGLLWCIVASSFGPAWLSKYLINVLQPNLARTTLLKESVFG